MRRVVIFFIAAVAAAFLWILITTQNAYAADATWNSTNSIIYNGNTYSGPASETTNTNLGLVSGAQAYTYVDPSPSDTLPNNEPNTVTVRKIHVIYFESSTDIQVATVARYKTLNYLGPNNYTNSSSPTNIAINQQSTISSSPPSSCTVSGGLGWIICPVTNFLANGVDWVFGIVSSFLVVTPTTTNPDSALFRAWTYMRSFANVAFVIAFLIIIYSQLTSFGISNYGIKKLLPRLIIAALLVNLSYYICAIVVDISNILGYSIQSIFINIRNSLMSTSGNSWDYLSWSSITGFILSGGTLATVGTIALVTTLSSYGIIGSLFLLLPSLVTALMAVLVALLVLAARQAIITVLIILAPLAFVAYLLPNTEKWFEKWQSTFMTMLTIFPAFSIIFGGSQLASAAIIQSADSINLIILGMLIQIAPLFITPFLLNMSGALLGKVAGLASSTNKRIKDKSCGYMSDQADNIKARRLADAPRRHQLLRRNAQAIDHRRRRREAWKSAQTGMADARWANSSDFSDIDQNVREYSDNKALGESRSELRYNSQKAITGSQIQNLDSQLRETKHRLSNTETDADNLYKSSPVHQILHENTYRLDTEKNRIEQTLDRDLKTRIRNTPGMLRDEMEVRVLTDEASREKVRIDQIHEELRAGRDTSPAASLAAIINRSETATRDLAIVGLATESAKRIQKDNIYSELLTNNVASREAGGIDTYGEVRVQATATAAAGKVGEENVSAAGALLSSQNYNPNELLEVARGRLRNGSQSNIEQRQAAVQQIIQNGYEPEIATLIDDITSPALAARNAGINNSEENISLQKSLGSYLASSSKKPKYFPGPMLGALSRGEMTKSVNELTIEFLINEKLSMEVAGGMPVEEMIRVRNVLHAGGTASLSSDQRQHITNIISDSISDPAIKAKLNPNQFRALNEILNEL